MRTVVLPGLDPGAYRPHPLHASTSAWPETNCYADLWIELLHALDFDPVALLPFCLAVDFDGDQWTFFKPSLEDLWSLYGIDVQELNLWDSLCGHIEEQVARGNLPLVEVDAFYLPDTRGTSYRNEHTKTTIGINEIDIERSCLRYFHNGGYYELTGDDFRPLLCLDIAEQGLPLPPYAEFARLERRVPLNPEALRRTSFAIAQRHLRRCPVENPFIGYRTRFAHDLETLLERPASYYHRYAFATVRQFGAAFHLAAIYLRWQDHDGLSDTADAFDGISETAKTLLLKMARAVHTKRPLAYEPLMDTMETNWQRAFDLLHCRWDSK